MNVTANRCFAVTFHGRKLTSSSFCKNKKKLEKIEAIIKTLLFFQGCGRTDHKPYLWGPKCHQKAETPLKRRLHPSLGSAAAGEPGPVAIRQKQVVTHLAVQVKTFAGCENT